ncbi:MAG: hypothetical protein ACI835_005631 [Planctomycetota bacterium]
MASGTPAGCVLGNGTTVPIPGIYILSLDGKVEASVALAEKDAHKELLDALGSQ